MCKAPSSAWRRKPLGRPGGLDVTQKKQLSKALLAGAVANDFPTDLRTLARVAKLIEREFGVTYGTVNVWRILRELGFSSQRPAGCALQRDAQPQEAVRQDAALEEGVELILDESRQLGSGVGLGVGDEAGCVPLHQTVQRGLLGTVAFVVDWGARPAPSGAVGRWLAREAPEVVSSDLKPRTASQSLCRASTYGCLLAGAYLRVATS